MFSQRDHLLSGWRKSGTSPETICKQANTSMGVTNMRLSFCHAECEGKRGRADLQWETQAGGPSGPACPAAAAGCQPPQSSYTCSSALGLSFSLYTFKPWALSHPVPWPLRGASRQICNASIKSLDLAGSLQGAELLVDSRS